MASPACTGSAPLLLFACLHLCAVNFLAAAAAAPAAASPFSFSFDFSNASSYSKEDLNLEGEAKVNGDVVDVTCTSYRQDLTNCTGRVSYAHPVPFYDNTTGQVASFQTRFTLAIIKLENTTDMGDGMAFFLAHYPSKLPPQSYGENLGLMDRRNGGNSRMAFGKDQFVAVEFDTYNNSFDPRSDHIGIDINSVRSESKTNVLSLNGSMTATVTFDNTTRMLVAQLEFDDDKRNLGPVHQVSWILPDPVTALLPAQVAVGFSAATGRVMELHQILSWSFNSTLAPPRPPPKGHAADNDMKAAVVGGSIGGAVALVILVWFVISCFQWTRTTSHDFVARTGGARRFEYSVLAAATDDFSEERIIGQGAFGVVYRGTFPKGSSSGPPSRDPDGPPSSESAHGIEVAVKKILKQGKQPEPAGLHVLVLQEEGR